MKPILKLLPWKRGLVVSVILLVLSIAFNFYGLYTNEFFFFKIRNFLFPLATIVHFVFLYVLWFKIKEDEIADPQMRNLEYALYAILPVYLYKLISTVLILGNSDKFAGHELPSTFNVLGSIMITTYLLLIMLALLAIVYRKKYVGSYNFDEINQIDSWE